MDRDDTLLVIIAADLNERQVEALVAILKRLKRAIGWTITNIIGIPLLFSPKESNSCLITNQILSIKGG